jgi:hypothetical protein
LIIGDCPQPSFFSTKTIFRTEFWRAKPISTPQLISYFLTHSKKVFTNFLKGGTLKNQNPKTQTHPNSMNAYEYKNPNHHQHQDMHQMLSKSSRTQSKNSNLNPKSLDIFDNYDNSTQLRTSSGIGRSSTYYSKSEFDGFNGEKTRKNQNSHKDPNGTYSKVLESTNFTVSEGNTKDSSNNQGDILERVVMDLVANCDDKSVLEKNLWQIENYMMSLKYEQNHLDLRDCNSSKRSENMELQKKFQNHLLIKKKMEDTLGENHSEREYLRNLFRYVVRDQKKEFVNFRFQIKQMADEKSSI